MRKIIYIQDSRAFRRDRDFPHGAIWIFIFSLPGNDTCKKKLRFKDVTQILVDLPHSDNFVNVKHTRTVTSRASSKIRYL